MLISEPLNIHDNFILVILFCFHLRTLTSMEFQTRPIWDLRFFYAVLKVIIQAVVTKTLLVVFSYVSFLIQKNFQLGWRTEFVSDTSKHCHTVKKKSGVGVQVIDL